MKKKNKYATGTGKTGVVRNYMPAPNTVLAENSIDIAEAKYDATSNPWTMGLDALGQMGMQYGISQGGFNNIEGINGKEGQGKGGDIANTALMALSKFAFGGKVDGESIEVEGDEVIETPDGGVFETDGPTHEQGGMDMDVPFGSEIFADRILRDGKTMAERKLERAKKEDKVNKRLDNTIGDTVLKNTLKRVKTINQMEEDEDLQLQETIKNALTMPAEKKTAAYGMSNPWDELLKSMQSGMGTDTIHDGSGTQSKAFGTLEPATPPTMSTPGINPEADTEAQSQATGGMTGGDITGLIGNQVSTFGGLLNTLKSRATDKPNENYYEGFGEDALEANDKAKGFAGDQFNQLMNLIQKNATGSKRSGRIGARGVNTQRALDIATDQNTNDANAKGYAQYAQQMMGILNQESQLENQQDHVVMRGEEGKGLRDIEDKDAHYSNMAQDIASIGEGIQQTGKDLNQTEQNRLMMTMLQQLSKYGITFDKNYKKQNPTQ